MDEIDMPTTVGRAADLWFALVKDVTANPCKYPCLRDDLVDWLSDHIGVRVMPPAVGEVQK